MVDRNINYNRYFLRQINDFDESTMLNPNLTGNEKIKLNKNELKIKNNKIKEFCKENSIS